MPESPREMAMRHVEAGRRIVESQRQLIEQLKTSARPTLEAERLLATYLSSLRIFEDELESILAKELK
jgi:hypothetical protein